MLTSPPSEFMWWSSIICLDCVSYCEGHFQCLLKQRAYDLSISPLAPKCANNILCTRLLTLSPLAKVWMVISLLALTRDFTHTHAYIIGTHSIGLGDLWPLSSFAAISLVLISSRLFLRLSSLSLPPNVSLPHSLLFFWHHSRPLPHSTPPFVLSHLFSFVFFSLRPSLSFILFDFNY